MTNALGLAFISLVDGESIADNPYLSALFLELDEE